MSFIYRDFLTPARQRLNSYQSIRRRMNKVWPIINVNGEDVYDSKLPFYTGVVRSDIPFKRFMNKLGVKMSTLTKQDYDHVDSAWFYINPNKYSFVSPTAQEIADQINSTYSVGDVFTVNVTYGGDTFRYYPGHDTSTGAVDTVAIRALINTDPMLYAAGISAAEASSISAYTYTTDQNDIKTWQVNSLDSNSIPPFRLNWKKHKFDVLAFLDTDGSVFERVQEPIEEEIIIRSDKLKRYFLEYSYSVKFKKISDAISTSSICTNSALVAAGVELLNVYTTDKQLFLSIPTTSIKTTIVSMNTSSSFLFNPDGNLKYIEANAMSAEAFGKMIGKSLDMDYFLQDTKWYHKVLAVVIIIIAIIIAAYTGQYYIAQGASQLTVAGAVFGAMSLSLTIGSLVMSYIAPGATDMVKFIGAAAQSTGYLSFILGIWASIQTSYTAYAKEMAKETGREAATYTVGEYVYDLVTNYISSLWDDITSIGSEGFSSSVVSEMTLDKVSTWMQNLSQYLEVYFRFFGEKVPSVADDQSMKEDGVEDYYVIMAMAEEQDALHKMDIMITNSEGGNITQNYLEAMK